MGKKVANLAARQHGIVTSNQLLGLGFTHKQIHSAAKKGVLHKVHHTVYAVGHPRLTREGRFLAAVLASGPGAVLSHGSAAYLWRIRDGLLSPVHVTVPTTAGRKKRPGIVVHRTPEPIETETLLGTPVTTPARTLLDLAEHVTTRQLERAIDEAVHLNLITPGALAEIVAAHPGRTGAKRLKRVRATHTPGTTRTRSEVEELFLAFCRRHDLPQPIMNAHIDGAERDAYFPDADLVVEIDPWHTHKGPRRFSDDRARDRQLLAAGRRTFRLTDEDFDPETADQLRRALR